MNIIRRYLHKIGLDIHRYDKRSSKFDYIKEIQIKTVLDIGANVGQFASEIRNILPDAKILSFEPIKDCFDKLNIKMQNDDKFYSFNYALGEEEREVEINKNEYLPSSSILTMSKNHTDLFPHTQKTTKEKILIKKMDEIIELKDLEKEILIKIDAQGFEDKIIKGGINIIKNSKAMLVETSFIELYKNQPLFDDIYKQLTEIGFTYKGGIQEKTNKKTGEIISEDSLFIQ